MHGDVHGAVVGLDIMNHGMEQTPQLASSPAHTGYLVEGSVE
jgi:hypothetical protein